MSDTSNTNVVDRRIGTIVGQLVPQTTAGNESTPTASTTGLTGPSPSTLYGGLLAARALAEQGVTHVFTLTGGHIAPILVGCEASQIRVVDVRDEATTVFAADGMSRLTGIPGVAIITAGPGLTNTVTAVKNAQLAQSPVIVFAGATAMILKGRGSLQDIDQIKLMSSAVKASWSISSVREIIPTIRRAFRVAQDGVPGPVFVEFPIEILWPQETISEQIGVKTAPPLWPLTKNSLMQNVKHFYLSRHLHNVFHDGFAPIKPLADRSVPTVPVPMAAVKKVHTALLASKSPIMLIGSQAIKAGPVSSAGTVIQPSHVVRLKLSLERLGVPVFLSGMGRGLLGKNHPLLLRHNRSKILKKADLVILVGVPADFRLESEYGRHIPVGAKFFTVNLCSTTLNKNNDIRNPDLKVLADPLEFVQRLAELSPTLPTTSSSSSISSSATPSPVAPILGGEAWARFINDQQAAREREIDNMANKEAASGEIRDKEGNTFVNPLRLCRILDQILPEQSIIVADGGDFVGTASYTVKPRHALSWLDPGVFGTLGVGAGFALAAALSHPQETVVILYGDGASGYGLIEFDTYVRMKVPVIAIIGNDACWSQMYRDQIRLLKSAVATELAFTHYERVVEGFGAKGILVRRESEIRPAFAQALEWTKQGHPVCINVMIAKSGFREGSISL